MVVPCVVEKRLSLSGRSSTGVHYEHAHRGHCPTSRYSTISVHERVR